MNNLTLIHLVSEQTMQNLLPIMALWPARVIQICSARADVARHSSHLEEALKTLAAENVLYRDLRPACESREIQEASPSISATEVIVRQAINDCAGQTVVNVTGGTKLMSIGAWRAAEAMTVPALYCDTQSKRFVIERAPAGQSLPPFEHVVAGLSVPVALAAHGIRPDQLKFEKPTDAHIALANAMLELWEKHESAMKDYFGKVRAIVYPGGQLVRNWDVARVIQSGLPPAPPNLVRIIELAAAAEILVREGELIRFNVSDSLNSDRKVREVERLYRALEGGWFEVLLYDRMRSSKRFLDTRMNVQSREEQSFGENDVVAVDLKRLALTFVSCKNTDAYVQPLDHVFSIRQRALEYGGSHAGMMLCVRKCLDPQKRNMLKQACAAVRAEFIEGEPRFT